MLIEIDYDALSAELVVLRLDQAALRRAALVVCAQAQDTAEARELMEALGLVAKPPRQRRGTGVIRRRSSPERSPISPALAAELRAAHEAEAKALRERKPRKRGPRRSPATQTVAQASGMHGHMVGVDRHLRAGIPMCPPCQELFDYAVAAGYVRLLAD